MVLNSLKHPSNWRVADLERDQRWVFRIDAATRQEMIDAVLKAEDSNKSLLDNVFFKSFMTVAMDSFIIAYCHHS